MSPTTPPITPPAIPPACELLPPEDSVLEEDEGVTSGSSLEGLMNEPGPNSGESIK